MLFAGCCQTLRSAPSPRHHGYTWIVRPERWARFFQDAATIGGLTDEKVDKIESLGAEIGRAAAKMAAADRKLEPSDVLTVELAPAASRRKKRL